MQFSHLKLCAYAFLGYFPNDIHITLYEDVKPRSLFVVIRYTRFLPPITKWSTYFQKHVLRFPKFRVRILLKSHRTIYMCTGIAVVCNKYILTSNSTSKHHNQDYRDPAKEEGSERGRGRNMKSEKGERKARDYQNRHWTQKLH